MERTPRYGPPVTHEERAEAAALLAQAIMDVGRANELVPGVEAVEDALESVERAYRDPEFQGHTDEGG